ncbi:ribosomal protein S18-alanine N-acetyltransferase [Psychrobacter sp. DAB_AL62B]|uniref:ribosomal protein S18-alanine N-acetyltransferase n=1 Tax=Psychrobacter sp. DAB_AL62B TaxID=1028420 RepID=UPI002380E9BF|nr:ribosomal protein S18-alanine N-acetyltransferase [Psychrobacter sp. DAB_AL62B]MDE4455662.1 ribosomal-protein-alanine N-acetyltransferase [Psychrobacter sp. DAB_AL62B]
MFNIEILTTDLDESIATIKNVAAIEAVVQLQEPWTYQTLNDLLEQDSISLMVVIHTSKNEVIGYCLYQVLFEQAEILRIGTHPDYQRQSIASQLFSKLNRILKNEKVESLLLEVRADNAPAIALYEQQRFEVIHRRKGYYKMTAQPAIDALIMQRMYR